MAARTLLGAARLGDRLEELRVLRKVLARSITAAEKAGSWREISPLAGKLIEVGRELEQLTRERDRIEAEALPDEPFDDASV